MSHAYISDLALWSIVEYGVRNRTIHRDLDVLKEERNFERLVKVSYEDRKGLDSI
jgi:hypothetical protein